MTWIKRDIETYAEGIVTFESVEHSNHTYGMRVSIGRSEYLIDPLDGDVDAVMERDPSMTSKERAMIFHMGLHVVSVYRVSHELWINGEEEDALKLSYITHKYTGADIHPAAKIGEKFFVDHATGVVIGETSEIGNNVSIFQGVTLGGVSSERGKRHPTIGNEVVIGTNATVLGNITIGDDVRIGAGSVVLKDVPSFSTVVGVPGKILKQCSVKTEWLKHDDLPDPVKDAIACVEDEIEKLKKRLDSGGI